MVAPVPSSSLKTVKTALFVFLALNFMLWWMSNRLQAEWTGVPPVPSKAGAAMMTLGDTQLSYRFWALALQNLGDGGGRITPLKEYDYEKLGKWFWFLHGLDPASEHVPLIAAFYFGGAPAPEQVRVVVDYLGKVGEIPAGEKWRWLAHASYLARHRMKDLQLALDLAYRLSRMQPLHGQLPLWARQLPAFILKEQGEKESAKELIQSLLLNEKNPHPAEVAFMKAWLVEQMGVPAEEVERMLKKKAENQQAGGTE